VVATQSREGPTAQKARPTKLPSAAPLGRTSASLEGQAPHHEVSPSLKGLTPPRASLRSASLEGLTPPRVSLHLARGTRTPERVSASLEAALDPRRRTYSPDRSIKCSSTSWAPGSNVNPRHTDPLTPPGNHPRRCLTNPHCVVIPGAVRALCGKPGVIP
jgi:hypothetical protein